LGKRVTDGEMRLSPFPICCTHLFPVYGALRQVTENVGPLLR
jgi:hypothetical protein